MDGRGGDGRGGRAGGHKGGSANKRKNERTNERMKRISSNMMNVDWEMERRNTTT